ncbi:MAG TPA: MurR/RpiR family transcriptional regulator [Pseudonocardiaceae bacterium]|jgi:DNA-binding MurR/RpiR family transcriptional regulator|nr:MurR/RpiR family transcriptional regulator [Pseudonocardiaceae bacterium]
MTETEPAAGDSLEDRITARLATMTRAERQVAEYLRQNSSEVIFATAEQIGIAAGASNATVVRTARTLGYSGLQELRRSLGQRAVLATSPFVELQKRSDAPGSEASSLLAHVFADAAERLAETLRRIAVEDFSTAVDALADAEEVLCFGIGPSEGVADYLALRLKRIGRRARSTGATGFRLADDLLELSSGDVVVLYSPGRLLAEIEVVLNHAKSVGARAVLISDSLGPLFTDRVHVTLPAAHSAGNLTGEGLSPQVLTDALIVGIVGRDEKRAADTSKLLIDLRSTLTQSGGREHGRRNHREQP